MSSRIAHFITQYPKESHRFIQRGVLVLERWGFEILLIAPRGWHAELVDEEDVGEKRRTRYVLQPAAAAARHIGESDAGCAGQILTTLVGAVRISGRIERILRCLKSFAAVHVRTHILVPTRRKRGGAGAPRVGRPAFQSM